MNLKSLLAALAIFVLGSSFAFADTLWIDAPEGDPGDLVTVDVFLRYKGGSFGDSMSAFDIPLRWDASVCSVEAVSVGRRFRTAGWIDISQIDNQGAMEPVSVPKLTLSAYKPDTGEYVPRGIRKAGTLDFRILESVVPPESTCLDTLMEAFSPSVHLGFVDKEGINRYIPSFSAGCIQIYTLTDSLWLVGGSGYPGDLVPVEVWLQYQGGGAGDSMASFDIPLAYDATICTVEAITLGPEFLGLWMDLSRIDNQGTQGPPAIPKVNVGGWTSSVPICGPPVPRGTHLAGTVDLRILDTVLPPDSTWLDTLMQAFSPTIFLGFVDKNGITRYIPSFSTDCIGVLEYSCGDCDGDGNISFSDALFLKDYYFQTPAGSPAPIGEGDVNLDGRVDFADALYIKNYYYETPPGFPEPCNPP